MNNFDLIKKLNPKAFVELMFSLIKEYKTEKELLCLLKKEIPQKTLDSRDFQYFLKYLDDENGYSCDTAFLLFETNHSRSPTPQELKKLGIELGTMINHAKNS